MLLGKRKAPEIMIPDEGWINSVPLSLAKLNSKVVLLDFWTYTCVNCIRTLPQLKEMWAKYSLKGFMLIGVHTPEFDFEKDISNVRAAVKKHGILYPVANDPERRTWEKYGNTYWPRAALISKSGDVIMEHIGESGYDEIDRKISEELGIVAGTRRTEKAAYPGVLSPETYAGSLRNSGLGSSKVCTKEGCDEYFDPKSHEDNVIYLSGDWNQEPEFLEFYGRDGYLTLRFHAREANVVMAGAGICEIQLDGKPLDRTNSGKDIIHSGGMSNVQVDHPDMYSLVHLKEYETHELKILPVKGIRIFAFTYG